MGFQEKCRGCMFVGLAVWEEPTKSLHRFGYSCFTKSLLFSLGTLSSILHEISILFRVVLGQISLLHVCEFGIVRGTSEIIASFREWCIILFFLCRSLCFSSWGANSTIFPVSFQTAAVLAQGTQSWDMGGVARSSWDTWQRAPECRWRFLGSHAWETHACADVFRCVAMASSLCWQASHSLQILVHHARTEAPCNDTSLQFWWSVARSSRGPGREGCHGRERGRRAQWEAVHWECFGSPNGNLHSPTSSIKWNCIIKSAFLSIFSVWMH